MGLIFKHFFFNHEENYESQHNSHEIPKRKRSINPRIPKESLWHIILANWTPALITAIVGGIAIAFIVPFMQTQLEEKQRKKELWKSLSENLTNFVYYYEAQRSYERLIEDLKKEAEVDLLGCTQNSTSDPCANYDFYLKELEEYHQKEQNIRIKLRAELLMAKFSFGENVKQLINQYEEWYDAEILKRPQQLEDQENKELEKWRNKIIVNIGNTIE